MYTVIEALSDCCIGLLGDKGAWPIWGHLALLMLCNKVHRYRCWIQVNYLALSVIKHLTGDHRHSCLDYSLSVCMLTYIHIHLHGALLQQTTRQQLDICRTVYMTGYMCYLWDMTRVMADSNLYPTLCIILIMRVRPYLTNWMWLCV